MLDWLIIGGGMHGTHMALVLTQRAGVAPARLRILDPNATLLAQWERCTAATEMSHLRSTLVHHLALDPHDLWNFARRTGVTAEQFRGPYRRPALDLFRAHCQHVRATYQLDALHMQGRATALRRCADGWQVETNAGLLSTRNVLLAVSLGDQPRWPSWALALREAGAAVQHLYAPAVPVTAGPDTVVIGGGISAAQVALALAEPGGGRVILLLRHAIRCEDFDSPAGWVGPKELRGFHDEPDMRRRRAMIAVARRPGSMPDDVVRALNRAERQGLLGVQRGEVQQATRLDDGRIQLRVPGQTIVTQRVVLATGFTTERPGGAWLDEAIATYASPVAPCGYPVVGPDLAWAPGLYVTGGLAELMLGPVARNIAGARHAGARLVG